MRTVLVFIPQSRYIFKEMLNGVRRRFKDTPVDIQIVEYGETKTNVAKLLDFWKPAGCIVEASYGLPAQLAPEAFRPIPVVYLDPSPRIHGKPILEVRSDERECGKTAARELISADLVSYAFVGHPQGGLSWSNERGEVFIETVRLHNLPCRRFESPRTNAARKEALRNWLLKLPKPCGVFAANDFTAEELIGVCKTADIDVPKDVRIVSFDNDVQICLRANPTITSMWPDSEQSGFLCAETLMRKWGNPKMRKNLATYGIAGVIRRGSSIHARQMDFHICAAIRSIRDGACDPGFSVDSVAQAMKCSRRVAEMRFKGAIGHTIREEIRKTRFEHVFALLSSRDMPIEQIAHSCGFGTTAALRIAFRKRTGGSLRAWRKGLCRKSR